MEEIRHRLVYSPGKNSNGGKAKYLSILEHGNHALVAVSDKRHRGENEVTSGG
jgi:hypothetical protein